MLREVRALLAAHRDLAALAFATTVAFDFPGTLEEMLERATSGADTEEVDDDDYPLVDVSGVRVLARYVVELTFDDDSVRVIDLEDWLRGPAFAPVRDDYDTFCAVRVNTESGTIEFPNGADLSPAALYLESKPAVPA